MADKQVAGPHPKPHGQVAQPHWTGGGNTQGAPADSKHYGCDKHKPTKANRQPVH